MLLLYGTLLSLLPPQLRLLLVLSVICIVETALIGLLLMVIYSILESAADEQNATMWTSVNGLTGLNDGSNPDRRQAPADDSRETLPAETGTKDGRHGDAGSV